MTAPVWQRRRRRAAKLAARHAYARETLDLYQLLLGVQEPAHARALVHRPAPARLAEYAARWVAPDVVVAVESAGIATLAASAGPWLRERAEIDVGHWLA